MIFSTYGPSTPHLIASRLHKQTGIPWVAEFRDLWSLRPNNKRKQPFQFFQKQWEKHTLKDCSSLISVSELWAAELEAFHSKKATVITNGFDEEDYSNEVSPTTKFTITYTGNIYPGRREPAPLLEAVAELRQEGKISPDDIEVRFFGSNVKETVSPAIEKYNLFGFIRIGDFVPFQESARLQKESSALLLLSWNHSEDKGTLTGKIFEYIGARRPILALAYKGGAIDDLLQESGCGIIANEVNEIKSILLEWLGEFRQHGRITSHYQPEEIVIKSYTRREQAGKLAQVFDNTITPPNVPQST